MDTNHIREAMTQVPDKDLARAVVNAEILAENREELEQLMALRGITYESAGYVAFARQFCDNKLRDASLQQHFAATGR